VIGSNLAFDRGDSTRGVPNRPAIAGGAVALALVVGLGMFLSGSDHLFSNGEAHGWAWDAVIGNVNFSMSKARETKLLADPRVAAASSARYGQADLDGVSTEILAYNPEGSAPPKMLSGRLPRARDEIAPGAKLLRELHAHMGSTIRLSIANSEFASASGGRTVERSLTVVGIAIPPVLGESELGEVAVVPLSAIAAAGGETQPQLVLARVRGDDVAASVRGLARDYTPDIVLDNVPSRVVNLHRVRALPVLGGLLAAVLGTILLAYTLAVSVRVRERELGVLRALGMTSGRVGRVVLWQGAALALAVTVVGVPLGLALGSIVWRVVTDQLGVAPQPVITAWTALAIPVSLAIGVVVALAPARRARRLSVTGRLRAE
jgi:hypothetical protein